MSSQVMLQVWRVPHFEEHVQIVNYNSEKAWPGGVKPQQCSALVLEIKASPTPAEMQATV